MLPLAAPAQRDDWQQTHRRDIQSWATRSRLSVTTIERLLRAAGHTGDSDDRYTIANIDSATLTRRSHVLVATVESGTGCLRADVVATVEGALASIWHSSDDLCAGNAAGGEAIVTATKEGRLVVKRPSRVEIGPNSFASDSQPELVVQQYDWDGQAYKLVATDRFTRYKWNGRDYINLGLAP